MGHARQEVRLRLGCSDSFLLLDLNDLKKILGTLGFLDQILLRAVNEGYQRHEEYLRDDQEDDTYHQLLRRLKEDQERVIVDHPEGIVERGKDQTVKVRREIKVQGDNTGNCDKTILQRSRVFIVYTVQHDERQKQRRHHIHLEFVIVFRDPGKKDRDQWCGDAVDIKEFRILFRIRRKEHEENTCDKINQQEDPLCIFFLKQHGYSPSLHCSFRATPEGTTNFSVVGSTRTESVLFCSSMS